jgi:hypothetical protein
LIAGQENATKAGGNAGFFVAAYKKLHRHPEVLAAQRRASKDRHKQLKRHCARPSFEARLTVQVHRMARTSG